MMITSLVKMISWINLDTHTFMFIYNGYNYNIDTFVSVHFIFERTKEGKIATYPKICIFTYLSEVNFIFKFTESINDKNKISELIYFYCKLIVNLF